MLPSPSTPRLARYPALSVESSAEPQRPQVIGEGSAVRGGGAALTIFAILRGGGGREKAMRAFRLLSSLAPTAIALIGGKEESAHVVIARLSPLEPRVRGRKRGK